MKRNPILLVLLGGLCLGGALCARGQTFSVIKSFGVPAGVTGCNPACELVRDAAGTLYGTTTGGEGRGTVFKLRSDGGGFQVLRMFTNTMDGTALRGVLVLSGSTLYGTAGGGGGGGRGTLFSLGVDGSAFTVLKNFASTDPGSPDGGLVLGGNTLFGVFTSSFLGGGGIFRIQTDGTDYSVLKEFTYHDTALPHGRLLLGGDTLYGALSPSFVGSAGVFSVRTNGSDYTVLRSFGIRDGDPSAGLTLDGGTLYGVTSGGGSFSDGTVFKMSTNGSGYTVLKEFAWSLMGGESWPSGPLATDGSRLYGVTRYGGQAGAGALFALKTDGSGYSQLGYFNTALGDYPQAGLLLSGGMLYGTAWQAGNLAYGTVFRLSTSGGGLSVLKNFGYSDAANPYGILLPQGDALYGTTYQGGASGRGTVFKVNRDGNGYKVLRSFAISDGMNPMAGLVSIGDVLYGTTSGGGSLGWGAVFSMNSDGSAYTVLRSFAGNGDGSYPYGPLLALDGYLYGTTYSGGASNRGTVFRLTAAGADYSILNSFAGGTDGTYPYSGLIAVDGALYGTTSGGGVSNSGTIFRLNPDGSDYAVLKQFAGGSDGASPRSALVSDGAFLYGTTYSGGASGSGAVFAISTNGTGYTTLKNLTAAAAVPRASLVLNGRTLYGITSTGGRGNGAIFSLKTDGTEFTILKTLSATDGSAGYSGLALLGNTLYGTTSNGGDLQDGIVFALTLQPRWTPIARAEGAGAPFRALLSGVAGSPVVIEASQDLTHWLPLQTNVLGADPLVFTDAESPGLGRRFYRASAPP